MNITTEKNHNRICSVFLFCCLALFSGCGLTEYYTLDAPTVASHVPSWSTTDFSSRYFEFVTNEDGMTDYLSSSSEFVFLGTAVYYKIFNNHSTMESEDSAIDAVNTSSNYSTAATKMIETYGFEELKTSAGTISPLVKATGSNRHVYIRLTNYQSSDDYAAKITVAGTELAVPLRMVSVDSAYCTFDFGRTSGKTDDGYYNEVPSKGEDDVTYSSSFSSDGVWYVDLYAVAVGRDTTYTTSYSLVLHLGAVPIDANNEDN